MYYGILIYLYSEKNTQQKISYIQAVYNSTELVVSFDGEILAGEDKFPKKQRKLVEAWVALQSDELRASWIAWNHDGAKLKIKGLD